MSWFRTWSPGVPMEVQYRQRKKPAAKKTVLAKVDWSDAEKLIVKREVEKLRRMQVQFR